MWLLQSIFDPDPNLTSVRGLPVETTADTSQGKERSKSPPAVIPDHQETQRGANQDLFRYRIYSSYSYVENCILLKLLIMSTATDMNATIALNSSFELNQVVRLVKDIL